MVYGWPMRLPRLVTLALTSALLLLLAAPALAARTTVRNNGIGPLKIGMKRSAALKTGWLSGRAPGCELAIPAPITYQLNGPDAPAPIEGSAEFNRHRLTSLVFSKGVKTKTKVIPGRTSIRRAASLLRRGGYKARTRYDDTFQVTFLTATRKRRQRFGGYAEKRRLQVLGVPYVPLCE